MRTVEHFYKGYAIYNMKRAFNTPRSVFYIFPDCGRSPEDGAIDATTSLTDARRLIDVWTDSRTCHCGARRLPHDYRCLECLKRRSAGLPPRPPLKEVS